MHTLVEANLRGYNDRLGHCVGQTEFPSAAEKAAYEKGVEAAERAMGFTPVTIESEATRQDWRYMDRRFGRRI